MLDISGALVAFMIVLFLSMIYLLNTMMYKPLMDFMQKRDKSIADDLASIDSNDSEIKDLESKALANISEAKHKAADIKSSIIGKVKDELAKEFEAKKEALEAEMSEFMKSLEEKKETLTKELNSNLGQYKSAVEAKIKNI